MSVLPFCVVFNASLLVLYRAKPCLLTDVTPVGYGVTGGKYRIVLPVSSLQAPPTLKDRHAVRGGEINNSDRNYRGTGSIQGASRHMPDGLDGLI